MILLASSSRASDCYFSLVKGACWKDYTVTVDIMDAVSGKKLVSVTIPENKVWGREKFSCSASQSLSFDAYFTPTIWEADKNKHYSGKSTWMLPAKLEKGKTAWNVTLCFPREFSEVPAPPTATNDCACEIDKLPPLILPSSD